MLSRDAGGSSLTAVLVPYTVRLFLLKAGEYLGKLFVLLAFQGGDGITTEGAVLLVLLLMLLVGVDVVVVVVVAAVEAALKTHGPVLHLLVALMFGLCNTVFNSE